MTVYDTHAGDIRPLIARFFLSRFEREEAAQEIWLQVHRGAGAYDPSHGDVLPWLRAVATNRCRELLRARGRRPDPTLTLGDEDLVTDETPERRASADRLRAAVMAFAATLDGEEAAVFRLALVEERGHDEVAARVGISPRRCKYIKLKLLERAEQSADLRRALDELREP